MKLIKGARYDAIAGSMLIAAACGSPEDAAVAELSSSTNALTTAAEWARYTEPAMSVAGFTRDTQAQVARRFALIATWGSEGDVKCCDDYLGCFPVKVDKAACLAHLSLLGCMEGYEPVCDDEECACLSTD